MASHRSRPRSGWPRSSSRTRAGRQPKHLSSPCAVSSHESGRRGVARILPAGRCRPAAGPCPSTGLRPNRLTNKIHIPVVNISSFNEGAGRQGPTGGNLEFTERFFRSRADSVVCCKAHKIINRIPHPSGRPGPPHQSPPLPTDELTYAVRAAPAQTVGPGSRAWQDCIHGPDPTRAWRNATNPPERPSGPSRTPADTSSPAPSTFEPDCRHDRGCAGRGVAGPDPAVDPVWWPAVSTQLRIGDHQVEVTRRIRLIRRLCERRGPPNPAQSR